jgi:hypothetical protein
MRIGGGQLAMGESEKLRTLPRGSNNHAIASPQVTCLKGIGVDHIHLRSERPDWAPEENSGTQPGGTYS